MPGELARLATAVRMALATTSAEPVAIVYVLVAVVTTLAGILIATRGRTARRIALGGMLVAVPPLALSITSGMFGALLAVAVTMTASLLAGLAVLSLLRLASRSLASWVLAFGAGSGLNAYALFALGIMGELSAPAIAATEGGLALLSILALARSPRPADADGERAPPAWRPGAGVLIVGALMLQALVPYVLAPEVMYDATYYHLTLVRRFTETASLPYVPELFASAFPQLPHVLYAAATALSGVLDAGKLVHFATAIACLAAIASLGHRLAGPASAGVAAIAWLSAPLVLWESATAYADLFAVFFVVSAVLATDLWAETRRPAFALLAACLVAFGFGVRITVAVAALPLTIVILLFHVRSRRDLLAWLGAGAAGLAVALPWYVRAYVLTGNPVFPFLNAVFGSPLWERRNDDFNFDIFGMGHGIADLLLVPWRLTVDTSRFVEAPDGALGPLTMFGCLGAALALLSRSRRAAAIGAFYGFGLATWFISAQYARYLLPTLGVGAALSGCAVAYARVRLPAATGPLLAVCVGAASVAGFIGMVGNVPGRVPWAVDLGSRTREQYLDTALRHHPAYRWMDEHLDPRTDRVLGIGLAEWPIAYSEVPVYIGHMTQAGRQVLALSDVSEVAQSLAAGHFTHVLVDYFPRPTRFAGSYGILDDEFMKRSLTLVYANNYVYLYRVAAPPPSVDVEQLADPHLPPVAGSAWAAFGAPPPSSSAACAGVLVTGGGGYLQEFVARPDSLYTFQYTMAATTAAPTYGKLQVNWLTRTGDTAVAIEINTLSGTPLIYEMSSTSPPSATSGIVYVSGYGPEAPCVSSVSVTVRDLR